MTKVIFKHVPNRGPHINIHRIDKNKKVIVQKVKTKFKIEHSGKEFEAIGYNTKLLAYIWPIEEFIARHAQILTRVEIGKLKHLNPDGQTEGTNPRGLPRNFEARMRK